MFYILFYLCIIIVIRKFVFTENILKYKHCIITTKEVYCILYLEHVYCLMTVKQLTKLTRYSLLYSDRGIQVQYLTYISNLSNKICWSTNIKFTLAESLVKFCRMIQKGGGRVDLFRLLRSLSWDTILKAFERSIWRLPRKSLHMVQPTVLRSTSKPLIKFFSFWQGTEISFSSMFFVF